MLGCRALLVQIKGFLLFFLICSSAFAADQGTFPAAMPGANLPGAGIALDPAGNQPLTSPFSQNAMPQNQPNSADSANQIGWRIRIREAAAIHDSMVTLGDIGEIYGNPPPGVWERLAQRKLWAAPPEQGKPMQVNRARLAQALRESLGDIADLCLLPPSMAIQSGGAVMREDDLRSLVVRELTPKLQAMSGLAELADIRIPPYAFLAHPGQSVSLETGKIAPGRVPLRFVVQEVDGRPVRRFTGTVMINLWADVPCAAQPLNKGDRVGPEQITWMRKNLTFLKGEIWDGRGGPWEAQKSIGANQPILVTDLGGVTVIRKGAIVNLLYERGAVKVMIKAEALADGGPGETIAVRNLQSKKQVYGEVVNSDTVRVK